MSRADLRVRALLVAVATGWLAGVGAAGAGVALACSPPMDPSIEALGDNQVVLVGTTGELVAGGRAFHVERVYNGHVAGSSVVIAFKEGEPIGDCSYPVRPGTHLLIAPWMEPDGRLSADLGTLQADPASPEGRAYEAEAQRLFGRPDQVFVQVTTGADPWPRLAPVLGGTVAVGLAVLAAFWLLARRRQGGSRSR